MIKRKWKNRENVYIEKVSQSQPILMEIFVIDNAASIKCKGIPYDIIFISFSKSSRQCHIHIDGIFLQEKIFMCGKYNSGFFILVESKMYVYCIMYIGE